MDAPAGRRVHQRARAPRSSSRGGRRGRRARRGAQAHGVRPRAGARSPSPRRSARRTGRRAPRRARSRRAGRRPVGGGGSGNAFPRSRTRSGLHAAVDRVLTLALGRDDHEPRVARDPARDGRVEGALEGHFPQPGAEHPDGLEHVRDAPAATPGRSERRHGIPEAHQVRDVRPLEAPEVSGQRRRDAHPAIPHRGREVRDARALDRLDLCAARRTLAHVAERRGHDLDVVTEPHEPGDELVCDDDRAAESVRGPVRGAREQDPERGAHAREPTSKIV